MALMLARGVVWLVGILLGVLAFVGMLSPARVTRIVEQTMATSWGIAFAVGIRLALGLAMLEVAPVTPYPLAFTVVGWIAIIAAVVGTLLGPTRLQRFAQWWIDRFSPVAIRAWLAVALAFAAFLVYGVI